MDDERFDAWTRRRFGLATGGVLATLLERLTADDADAAKNKNKNRRKRKRRQKRRQRRRRNQGQNPPCTGPGCAAGRPDIVLINVDDMRDDDYSAMTRTRALLGEQGTTYPNYFLSTPLCAPSRASLLRGQYTHNTGVLRNTGPGGGWSAFRDSGAEQSTVATWLRDGSGYRTAHVGKYLNGYNRADGAIAPGWSDWVVPSPVAFYDYTLNVNGSPEEHGDDETDYLTDVMAGKAVDIIASTPRETPLFLYFAPKAPHGPSTPAPRHIGSFASATLNRPPSFNEADMSDKPEYMQRRLLDAEDIADLERKNRNRLESLLAVDEAVEAIVDALEAAGRLGNAYLFFVTDNGFLLGEHRRSAKVVPYDEATRMPMLARGPGVRAGQTNGAFVGNIDLAPTVAALAGVQPPGFVDGRSLIGTFDGSTSGRQAFLLAAFSKEQNEPEDAEETGLARVLARQHGVPTYRAIRTEDWVYVEYENAARERELYDLNADPFQLASLHADASYAETVGELSAWLATLKDCDGAACRRAEDAPPG